MLHADPLPRPGPRFHTALRWAGCPKELAMPQSILKLVVGLVALGLLSACGGKADTSPAPAGSDPSATPAQPALDWNKDYLQVLQAHALSTTDLRSATLNKHGYFLYQQANYLDAYILFRQAVAADPGNATAWYNRACMLALLWGNGAHVDQGDLFESLGKALELDRARRSKFAQDADLAWLKDDPRFSALVGRYCPTVYALSDPQSLGYWKNTVWVALPDRQRGERTTCLAVDRGDVYVGGHYASGKDNYDDIQVPGYWKNGIWTSLPGRGTVSTVSCLVIQGTDIYAGGWQSSSGTMVRASYMYWYFPGYWKNGAWNPFAPCGDPRLPEAVESGQVYALAVDGQSVYGCGRINNYQNYGISVQGYWKDSGFEPVGLPVAEPDGQLYCLAISGGTLYLAGGGQNWTGYWQGGEYVSLALKDRTHVFVDFLVVSAGDVYAASRSAGAGYWKNGAWVSLPLAEGQTGATVTSLAVAGGTVCVGGNQEYAVVLGEDAGGDLYYSTGYWLNGTWVPLTEAGKGDSAGVRSLVLVPAAE
jgi:hypothetical protein